MPGASEYEEPWTGMLLVLQPLFKKALPQTLTQKPYTLNPRPTTLLPHETSRMRETPSLQGRFKLPV